MKRKENTAADLKTIGFQLLGFLLGVPFGVGVVVLLIYIIRVMVSD
jgi:hypothetical protein